MRRISIAAALLIVGMSLPTGSQSNPQPQTFFERDVGLRAEQIAAIRKGEAVTKVLPSRTADEVFLFGGVHIDAAPAAYIEYAGDFERIRKLPSYVALGVFSEPPKLSDLEGFSFDAEDIDALRRCKPGDCLVQAPASSIEELQQSIDWSATNVSDEVNQFARARALQLVTAYQSQGNQALGVYNDKRDPTLVPQQFAYMLSYAKALPVYLPDFYRYLLDYPKEKPANVEDAFYWADVKFGLKPTLRIVHRMTFHGAPGDNVVYAVAEKQLYSSHYFETALDLSFCVRANDTPRRSGFYLIMIMGSEQAGLTGIKGSIVRKAAVDRSTSSLRDALTSIRDELQAGPARN